MYVENESGLVKAFQKRNREVARGADSDRTCQMLYAVAIEVQEKGCRSLVYL